MNHDALTNRWRLDAEERDRALAHAYDLQKRIARTLEQTNQARPGEHTLSAHERNIS